MHGRVVETRWLTPTLVRVVLGGGDLDEFAMVEATDAYVNLAFAPAGCAVRRRLRPGHRPRGVAEGVVAGPPALHRARLGCRTGELTIDFVVHGDVGVAGAWARRARPGDALVFEGPSGGYRPDPDADWLLMVGDESALPAIAASLESVPAGHAAVVRLLCDGPEHEVELTCDGNLAVAWVHRLGDGRDGAARGGRARRPVPAGRVHAFIHGEATEIREIRRHLLVERGLSRQDMSCSPYWRRDMTDEDWRKVKRDFVAAMDADVAETDPTTEVA